MDFCKKIRSYYKSTFIFHWHVNLFFIHSECVFIRFRGTDLCMTRILLKR